MALLSDGERYGALPKGLHWIIAALFALQFAGGLAMTRLEPGANVAGFSADGLYNWHKSLGLVALLVALVRLWARWAGRLPPWAPTLSPSEQRLIHRYEQVFYAAMLVMPVSGLIYVMAGGYGVLLFGLLALPNPIGEWKALAGLAGWIHVLSALALGIAMILHAGLVMRHRLILKDGLLKRMV
jgi:cytochrome b561